MTKRFDYEIGDFVADKFGNVYKVLDIDDSFRIPVRVEIVERKTETYFSGGEPSLGVRTSPSIMSPVCRLKRRTWLGLM